MADQKDVLAQQPSVWERCARIAERMTEMDQRAMENPNDDLLPAQRQSRIDAAKFIALTIRLAGKQESDGRTPAAVARAKQPCACDWTTGECQGPLGCKAFAEAASRTPAGCSPVTELDFMNWFITAGCTGMSVAQTAAAILQNFDVRPK